MGVTDVVVVGGGIGGASLAYALARAGVGVTVLEATEHFPDRVRGESMAVWGVQEARRLGVEDFLHGGRRPHRARLEAVRGGRRRCR
jgi:menaquinone-9 beta-reductase